MVPFEIQYNRADDTLVESKVLATGTLIFSKVLGFRFLTVKFGTSTGLPSFCCSTKLSTCLMETVFDVNSFEATMSSGSIMFCDNKQFLIFFKMCGTSATKYIFSSGLQGWAILQLTWFLIE
ncbi:hypothetical protein C0J52_22423 [Blattella germanica]|nr:hypothetical protein C0J52_22423 [Blattella germanica]